MTTLVAIPQHSTDLEIPSSQDGDGDYELVQYEESLSHSEDDSACSDTFIKFDYQSEANHHDNEATASDNCIPSLSEEDENDTGSDFVLDNPNNNVNVMNDSEESDTSMNNDESDEYRGLKLPSLIRPMMKSMQYGGLSNLGNTCYMASALQMIASIDSFVDHIRNNEPVYVMSDDWDEDDDLRSVFISLMQRLRDGETVRPGDLKAAVDRRSSLFVGYEQQDAHEFLTTFLDLLDEDYKRKNKPKEMEGTATQAKGSPGIENDMDIAENDFDISESIAKRAKTHGLDDSITKTDVSSFSCLPQHPLGTASFSELDAHAIELLVHGSMNERESLTHLSAGPTSTSKTHTDTKCKLAGGRMVTSDVALISYSEYGSNAQQQQSQEQHAPSALATLNNSQMTDIDMTDSSITALDVNNLSPVDVFFTTKVRVRLTCDSCKYTRSHEETYLHLSLEIESLTGCVEDSLRRFFAPERRQVKCEKCFCEFATQTTEITRLPRVLLLHFKRFIVDVSPDYSSVTYRKNQSAVVFEEELSLDEDTGVLPEFLATDCSMPNMHCKQRSKSSTYEIRSVVNHIGSSASCGHYTADAKKFYGEGDSGWTRFNDSNVTRITPQLALEHSRQTAYMVVYELQ